MAWPKGVSKSKTGGRKKGTPNKRSSQLVGALEAFDFDPLQDIINTLSLLTPKDRVSADLTLLPYLYPRRKTSDISLEEEDDPEVPRKLDADLASLKELIRDYDLISMKRSARTTTE